MFRWPPFPTLRREPPRLGSRLVLLALACTLPALLVAAIAIQQACDRDRDAHDARAFALAQQTLERFEAELAATRSALQVLAASPALAAGDFDTFAAQARLVAQAQGARRIVLDDAQGRTRIDTRIAVVGTAATRHRTSDTADPGAAVVELVVRTPDGHPRYHLAAECAPAWLAGLDGPAPQPDLAIGLLDPDGLVVAAPVPLRRLLTTSFDASHRQAIRTQPQGLIDGAAAGGEATRIVYSRSPTSGWTAMVATAAPARPLGLCAEMAGWIAGAGLLLAAGLAAAVAIARRIAKSIDGLVAPALALARGEALTIPALHLREADAVAGALAAASRLLSARTRAARQDALTALPNRGEFLARLHARIQAQRLPHGCLTVFFIDLDDFKSINDRFGHAVGDALLQAFATRLRGAIRDADVAGRLGGDEFAVLIDGLGLAAAEPVARALMDKLSRPYAFGEHRLTVSASIGLAGYPEDGGDADALLAAADQAMYRAKAAGKGTMQRGVARDRFGHTPADDGAGQPAAGAAS